MRPPWREPFIEREVAAMRRFHSCRRASGRRGFTLVEIILVTVILMILASIVVPNIAGRGKQAKINATKIEMQSIKSAFQEFEIHASRFPTTQEGLMALISKPAELGKDEWAGPYLPTEIRSIPKDKFGTEYKYVCPSEHGFDYDLISAGLDKKFGTDDDIYLFEENKDAAAK
jgi:general secretion pathway protein G